MSARLVPSTGTRINCEMLLFDPKYPLPGLSLLGNCQIPHSNEPNEAVCRGFRSLLALNSRAAKSRRDFVIQPRVATEELPWGGDLIVLNNPNGVTALVQYVCRNPVGVNRVPHRRPRVAPPSQPWAELRNPFGIEFSMQNGLKRADAARLLPQFRFVAKCDECVIYA
jgi:hypothetical protein